ncbi:hypothetical protein M441DRAFT_59140 [Trichoderma asperellum CBS 433.97]|uniref:Uncharacterized protein n=1 Tax=Trichoderma asperellum (strain ATCC 204424 / CBS 433.97 / NBRC 101777) TaxID=1042311 RepID=A0A2T3Z6C6_TRIA4|nr:hypothetical protein M441DRAFT_59140 [Trichoderma asperellum CBS 433.97]PTB40381.1 hypothetical protein M441DRAFT_59140 [Trichoderma asperellum CBS 433.97]
MQTRTQTTNGEYESIEYDYFSPVEYERLMYWYAGGGGLGIGPPGNIRAIKTDKDNHSGEVLKAGLCVHVRNTTFKLIPA